MRRSEEGNNSLTRQIRSRCPRSVHRRAARARGPEGQEEVPHVHGVPARRRLRGHVRRAPHGLWTAAAAHPPRRAGPPARPSPDPLDAVIEHSSSPSSAASARCKRLLGCIWGHITPSTSTLYPTPHHSHAFSAVVHMHCIDSPCRSHMTHDATAQPLAHI